MLSLFEKLCKAVKALKTDAQSIDNFFDSIVSIFRRVGQNRIALATDAFERANGLDILEDFQRESPNE